MKALFKNTSKTLIISLFLSPALYAKDIAVIQNLFGNVFIFNDGKVKTLKKGDVIQDLSEIVTEEGAQVSFSDFYDHVYHLAGSGNVKFYNKALELKKGYLWLQSYQNSDRSFFIHTANAHVRYTSGEGVISFDTSLGRTQVLALDGSLAVKNPILNFPEVDVSEGSFSVVDKDYESGQPRWSTKVGYNSFNKIMQLFSNVTPMDKNNRLMRETIASQQDKGAIEMKSRSEEKTRSPASKKKKPGKIIFVNVNEPSDKSLKESYLYEDSLKKLKHLTGKKRKKKFSPKYQKVSGVKINIHGVKKSKVVSRVKKAVAPVKIKKPQRDIASKKPASGFESSLLEEYKDQMRHSTEVNELIDKLKSYKIDYKKDY